MIIIAFYGTPRKKITRYDQRQILATNCKDFTKGPHEEHYYHIPSCANCHKGGSKKFVQIRDIYCKKKYKSFAKKYISEYTKSTGSYDSFLGTDYVCFEPKTSVQKMLASI